MIKLEIIEREKVVITEYPEASIFSQINYVNKELQKLGFRGEVLFDLLISKGFNERFMTATFDGERLDRSSVSTAHQIEDEIIGIQNTFFRENQSLLRASMLTRRQRKEFLETNTL